MWKKSLIFSLLTVISMQAMAQQPQVADKIIAVVGKTIILQSDVELQFENEKQSNPGLPDSAKCGILYTVIAQKILVEQAGRDSIIVTDEEVERYVDQRIRYFLSEYGSKEALEQASGRTIYQMKEEFRPFFRDRITAERMQNEIMKNVKITPTEVSAMYHEIPKDSLPLYPASVEMGQIVIKPDVSPEIENLAKEKLENIRDQIVSGGRDFATMASIYSMDGSKNNGGLLTINRREFDPQFVAAAYRLQPGEISPVIKTKFGYHIIKMERRMGDEAVVRHIIIVPEVTNVALQQTLKKMDSIRAELVSGKISFSEAVGKYSNDDESKLTGGMIYDQTSQKTLLPIEELTDPGLVAAASELSVGEFSQPQIFTLPSKARACRILYLKSRTEPHKLNLKDDYNNIQQMALVKKKNEFLNNWLTEKVPTYYIKVDPQYQDCTQLKEWNLTAAK